MDLLPTDIFTFAKYFREDIMKEDKVNLSIDLFNSYIDKFKDLTEEQAKNFKIKQMHSLRVAENSLWLSEKLKLSVEDKILAFIMAVFHDIGRFPQLVEYNTFNDSVSVDHADLGIDVLKENKLLEQLECKEADLIHTAILWHNKFKITDKLNDRELLYARLLRDCDKLDILRVLTDYYSDRNSEPNHTLTWELPKAAKVSDGAAKEILAGKLVSKKNVSTELDVKIMQMSWIFDLNFKASVGMVLEKRYLEKIYNSVSKNDQIIEIYRKVKVFAENKMME